MPNDITTQGETVQPPRQGSGFKKIFVGPHGLRAGWRLLIYILLMVEIAACVGAIARLFGAKRASGSLQQITPLQLCLLEGALFFYSVVAAWIMSKIEGRKFGDYGLPANQALRKDFWVGLLWGFLTTSGTLLLIFAFHGVRLSGPMIHGTTILTSAAAWTVTFLLVGLSEEFSFRGYGQFTLTSGMGFWPSAFLLSILFGAAHMNNSGRTFWGSPRWYCLGCCSACFCGEGEICGGRLAFTWDTTGVRRFSMASRIAGCYRIKTS